jgi:hypothetical protein
MWSTWLLLAGAGVVLIQALALAAAVAAQAVCLLAFQAWLREHNCG